jgi:hypothetical protein
MTQIKRDRRIAGWSLPWLRGTRVRAVWKPYPVAAPESLLGLRGPLAGAVAAHYIAKTMIPRPPRRLFEAGAALLGIAAGVLFAEPVLAAGGDVWHGFVLPAYDELIKNGVFAWCM